MPKLPIGFDAVYLRVVLYALSTVFAMIPLSWGSWVSYDAASQMLHISAPGLAAAIVMGTVSAIAVFKRWGAK